MEWLLLATGFTGALSLVYLVRQVYFRFIPPGSVEVFHSPNGGCTEAVVREIRLARREVLVQAFSFTSRAITQALVEAKTRGVHVEILLDPTNEQEGYSELGRFLESGLAVFIDAQHALAHNKVMILDRRTIITGSFNFTRQAEIENAENLLVIKGYRALAASYRKSYAAHKAHSQPPGRKDRPANEGQAA
jgi:phosphatidylserine/phosphatidylglycerophosphate/cardiolipin synthase-like enzyme